MSDIMVVIAAALAGELLLVLLVLLLVSWFRHRAIRRRDNKAMRVLVTRIKNGQAERETAIGGFLGERMGLAGEALEQAKVAIQRAELLLLQRFAGVYSKRDAGAAAQFDIDLVAALAPYHQLQAGGAAVNVEQAPTDPSELEALRAENARLSEELSVTMETMSRMLNEYSTMFAGGSAGAAASIGTVLTENADAEGGTSSDQETQQATPAMDAVDDIELDVDGAAAAETEDSADIDIAVDVSEVVAGAGDKVDADIDVVAMAEVGSEAQVDKDVAAETETETETETQAATEAEATVEAETAVVVEVADEVVVGSDPKADDAEDVMQDDIDALFAAGSLELLDETVQDVAASATAGTPFDGDLLHEEPPPESAVAEPSQPETDFAHQAEGNEGAVDADISVESSAEAVIADLSGADAQAPDLPMQDTTEDSTEVQSLDEVLSELEAESTVAMSPEETFDELPMADEGEQASHRLAESADLDADLSTGPDELFDQLTAEDLAIGRAIDQVAEATDLVVEPQDSEEEVAPTAAVPEDQMVPAIEIEGGDDMETVTSIFEEGAAEVVGFDEPVEFDVGVAISDDDLFDPVESETIVRAEAAVEERSDDVEAVAVTETEDLFDAADEPLKTQSGQ